uniref:CRAL-TRIO domain-containing protein n=1 Tax=Eutreptiella gymnastica TaxID=73025 RepID=A0A7S1J558_9EUGL
MALDKDLRDWADDACLDRYLRARSYNVDKAEAMLAGSLKWRREFGTHKLLGEYMQDVQSEGAVGKMYVHGKDNMGRPVIYMKPRLDQQKGTQVQQMRHLVYTLERAISMMENGVEKFVLLIDFNGYSLRNAPSISTQRETLSILQNQYPERLGLAVCYCAPFLFNQSFKLIKPFIDPVTAAKLAFVSEKEKVTYFSTHFPVSCLERDYSGDDPTEYNPAQYFAHTPAIVA